MRRVKIPALKWLMILNFKDIKECLFQASDLDNLILNYF